jgi:hypothetical protein
LSWPLCVRAIHSRALCRHASSSPVSSPRHPRRHSPEKSTTDRQGKTSVPYIISNYLYFWLFVFGVVGSIFRVQRTKKEQTKNKNNNLKTSNSQSDSWGSCRSLILPLRSDYLC